MEGEARFETCPYVGVAEHDVDGQPQGLALRREGWVPASARTTGGESRRGASLRGNHRTSRRWAQPQGLPLRRGHVGRDVDREEEGRLAYPPLRLVGSWVVWGARAGLKPAPTEKGLVVEGVGKMGPRMREDDGRGKVVRELPLRGNHRTRRRRATTRVALRRRHVGRDVDREKEGRFAYPPLRLVGSWVVWRTRGGLNPAAGT